jgi:GGDEF domain-containing protein
MSQPVEPINLDLGERDALTGLYDRQFFNRWLSKELTKLTTDAAAPILAVMSV